LQDLLLGPQWRLASVRCLFFGIGLVGQGRQKWGDTGEDFVVKMSYHDSFARSVEGFRTQRVGKRGSRDRPERKRIQ